MTGSSLFVHRGLAAKLFTTLTLLGAIAVTVTGALGYFRVREALESAIFDQLTTARQARARQIETYFRTIHADLRLLASSKMIVEATPEFRGAVDCTALVVLCRKQDPPPAASLVLQQR